MGQHSAVWQGYVDSSLMGSGKFDKAAILSPSFSEVEASSPGFSISAHELAALKEGFKDPTSFFANGITVGGEKFVAIKAEGRSVYGKKGKEGVVVVQSVSCVFVTHHPETVLTQDAAQVVENLTDYINNPR